MQRKVASKITVTPSWKGTRLDRFVRAQFPELSFVAVQMLIRKGKVLLNGERAQGSAHLEIGDSVSVEERNARAPIPTKSSPKDSREDHCARLKKNKAARSRRHPSGSLPRIGIDVAVLYEDDEVLVLDKPSGVVVQPGNLKEKGSFLDSLEEYRLQRTKIERPSSFSRSASREESREEIFRYAPVHRLDRETSGVLIVAKTRPAARYLSRAFALGMIKKTYLAVVEGVPSSKKGHITLPLRVEKGYRSRTSPETRGMDALTHYSLLRRLDGGRSLLAVEIETGRTHQIRVHLASIGHPICGDRQYGNARGGGRLLLHAWKISFPHPGSGRMVFVTSPPPEGDLDPDK